MAKGHPFLVFIPSMAVSLGFVDIFRSYRLGEKFFISFIITLVMGVVIYYGVIPIIRLIRNKPDRIVFIFLCLLLSANAAIVGYYENYKVIYVLLFIVTAVYFWRVYKSNKNEVDSYYRNLSAVKYFWKE